MLAVSRKPQFITTWTSPQGSLSVLTTQQLASAGASDPRGQRTENCLELWQIILVVILGEGCNVFYDLASEVTFHHVHNALLITQVSPWWEGTIQGCECQGQSHCMVTLEADCYISHKIKGHFNGISWEFPSMSLNTTLNPGCDTSKEQIAPVGRRARGMSRDQTEGGKFTEEQCRKGLDSPIRKKERTGLEYIKGLEEIPFCQITGEWRGVPFLKPESCRNIQSCLPMNPSLLGCSGLRMQTPPSEVRSKRSARFLQTAPRQTPQVWNPALEGSHAQFLKCP